MKHFYKKLKGILYKEKSFKQELEDSLNVVIPNEIELGEKIELVDETVELKQ